MQTIFTFFRYLTIKQKPELRLNIYNANQIKLKLVLLCQFESLNECLQFWHAWPTKHPSKDSQRSLLVFQFDKDFINIILGLQATGNTCETFNFTAERTNIFLQSFNQNYQPINLVHKDVLDMSIYIVLFPPFIREGVSDFRISDRIVGYFPI